MIKVNMKMSRKKALAVATSTFVLMLILCRSSNDEPAPKKPESAPAEAKDDNHRNPEDLLDESEKLAGSLEDNNHEHAFYLGQLCLTSREIHSPKTLDRCLRAFREAEKLQSECDRDHLQARAVAQISFVNPSLAMDMLDKLHPPTYCTEAERAYWHPKRENGER